MELGYAYKPRCVVPECRIAVSERQGEHATQRKVSPSEKSHYCDGSLRVYQESNGGYSSPSSEGSFSPENCSTDQFMFEFRPLENGRHSHHSLIGHGSQDVSMTVCKNKMAASNGFHDSENRETMSERAVGYGRPRSWSQPAGLSIPYGRTVSSGEKMDQESCSKTKPESMKPSRWSDGGFEISTRKRVPCYMKQELAAMRNYQVDHRLSCLASRLAISKNEEISRRYSTGRGDLHPSNDMFPVGHSAAVQNSEQNTSVDFRGVPRSIPCEATSRREMLANGVVSVATSSMNGWHQIANYIPEASIQELLKRRGQEEPLYTAIAVGEEPMKEASYVNGDTSPTWYAREKRTSPGVIGGERKNDNSFVGRRRSYEDFPANQRRSTHAAFDNSPRKESRNIEAMRPRPRSNGDSPPRKPNPVENGSRFCSLCRLSLVSEAQVEEHLRSTKHLNRLAKYNAVPYKKFCDYCKVHLNSESQAREHFSSGRHEQTVAKSQKAPIQHHYPLITEAKSFVSFTSTSTKPYGYQVELFQKSMEGNAVCFLPTGTGKTLVAALVIAHMLQLNPSRQVIFLVDRVLLVLQQSDYLRKELGDLHVVDDPIPGKDSPSRGSFNRTRPVRIGAVCGEMRKLEGNARIYEQDVLIITADCYRNHLNNGTLRFEDVSLLVLDEAHHCNKDHPYNVIIRDFYLREDVLLGHRPKILGLTASPAGETSLDKTTKRLQRLLGNLGDARLLIVEENTYELQEKTSRASPVCVWAAYTQSEHNLLEILMEYVTKSFNVAVRLSELKDYKDIFQPSSGGLFSAEDIFPVLRVIDNILLQSRPESNALSSLIHFQLICEAVCTLQECGETVALDQLMELTDEGCPHGFDWAHNMGLPCSRIQSSLEYHVRKDSRWNSDIPGFDSGVRELLEQLLKMSWTGTSGRAKTLVLVLVKRRRTARCLAKYLSNYTELLMRDIRTTCIVGHGTRSGDGGMNLAEQKETLLQIREGYIHVVVATSVAEDGLDLPVCKLVIQMDPPSSVAALVQIRGGARQNDAKFVAICRSNEQARKIDDLLKREENMRFSARIINGL